MAMGPYQGGQAQYLRVPYADFNCLTLPVGTTHESDFILLADIFPTGWHGVVLSGFKSGESIAVFGAGPVGLMAAYSAVLRGASRVYVVDSVKERLDAARKIGCEAVDFSKGDPVEAIVKANGGMVDRSVDAVGYQASAQDGKKEAPSIVLENCIKVTRPTGGIGVPGLYVPSDPGAPDSNSGQGMLLISFGKLFEKVRSSTSSLHHACSNMIYSLPNLTPHFNGNSVIQPGLTSSRASRSAQANATSRCTTATFAT